MRLRAPLVTTLLVTTLAATQAHADEPAVAAAPTPETTTVDFGGQIIAADVGALALGIYGAEKTGQPLFLSYAIAAPIVHLAHGDRRGAMGSLALHVAAPLAGGMLGFAINRSACGGGDFMCGLGGLGLGGLAGILTATLVDAKVLAHVERPAVRRAVRNLPVPTVATAPGGGFMLGVAGRL